jgi:hypothetical protein
MTAAIEASVMSLVKCSSWKAFRFRATSSSMAAFRTQLFGPNDMDNVKKVQSGYKVQPLSAYLKQPARP